MFVVIIGQKIRDRYWPRSDVVRGPFSFEEAEKFLEDWGFPFECKEVYLTSERIRYTHTKISSMEEIEDDEEVAEILPLFR